MSVDVLVKFQPRVIEHFDIRIDCVGMFTLIQTLRVAVRELDVDESIPALLEALVAQYDQSVDGDPAADDEASLAT